MEMNVRFYLHASGESEIRAQTHVNTSWKLTTCDVISLEILRQGWKAPLAKTELVFASLGVSWKYSSVSFVHVSQCVSSITRQGYSIFMMSQNIMKYLDTFTNGVILFCSGLQHQSWRPDVLLEERQTSLQETRSHTEDINCGVSSGFFSAMHLFILGVL